MMGTKERHFAPLINVSVEELVPQDHFYDHYQRTSDFKVSTTDPDATPMRLKGRGTHLGYHIHYVVDGGKARIILRVLVTLRSDGQPTHA